MSFLTVSGISREEDGNLIVANISFTQPAFQKLAIAGATGSGKTTLLKMIAGLVQPSSGMVTFEGVAVKGPEEKLLPGHPGIAYLSQHFELRNNYRVEELLEIANILSDEEAGIIYKACRIDHLLKRRTNQVSGGERQRISLAMTLVAAPKLLLLDEPFSNLDALHKNMLKSVINDLGELLQFSCIIVSHDPADLLSWADEIILLQNGRMVQRGAAAEIYKHPASEYAAALFGKYNVLHPALAKALSRFTDIEMNRINSFVRPEGFVLVADESTGVKGIIQRVHFMGSYNELEVDVLGGKVIVHAVDRHFKKADVVYIALKE